MLAHDTYDDLDHTSRTIVGSVTLALVMLGIGFSFRAAIREARGSENALCSFIRRALPRNSIAFTLGAVLAGALALCAMEACDALLAGGPVDDIGDLFGGSVGFGGTIVTLVAVATSAAVLGGLRRLARVRSIAGALVAFLRRALAPATERATVIDFARPVLFRAHHSCRRLAGRAPPPARLVATL